MVTAGNIWVIGTSCLIAFIAYSPQLTGLFDGISPTQQILFNLLVALIYYNYYLVVKTDPGSVPKHYDPLSLKASTSHEPGIEPATLPPASTRDVGDLRYCKKCENFKAPRSHHCRYCKRCTLRYDHHCPWINNCVGFHNYVYFLRFLFFVDIGCAMHLYLLTFSAFNIELYRNRKEDPTTLEVVFLVLNYVTCIPVLVTIGLFSLYHYWNVITNTTTIEGSEIDRAKRMVRRGKIAETIYPFNVGILHNITTTIGHTPVEWLFLGKPTGDGLSYPYAEGSDPLHWPPRDPYEALKQSWEREAAAVDAVLKLRYPPYHPAYSALDAEDDEDDNRLGESHRVYRNDSTSEEEESDDDIPLSRLRHRSVRLRRGSEGLEVRPLRIGAGYLEGRPPLDPDEEEGAPHQHALADHTNSDWEELYPKRQGVSLYDSGSEDD